MTDDDIGWLDMGELARRIRAREVSATEVAQAMLRRIERHDPTLRAYALVTPELALGQARDADAALARGEATGPLHGVPIAVKDLCWTRGVRTAAGTVVHRDFVPEVDGTVVRRLREAGAVLLGKLQMTEAAFSAHHPQVTPPRNPWNHDAWTGSSSSGSGVAVAAALTHGAIGSDTGGSIRFPSAACGVTGLKPTWGRVSRFGAFELAASLDHLGPMCRSAADCGRMLGAIAGADADDPTALPVPVPDYLAGDTHSLAGVRIGIDEAWTSDRVEPEVVAALHAALEVLRRLGAVPVAVRMPPTDPVVAAWRPICAAEAALAHDATFPSRRDEYGPMLAGVLDAGRALSALDYQRALLVRADFTGRMNALMTGVDLLLMPAMPLAGASLERITDLRRDPDHRIWLQRFSAPSDMTGQPTITLPAGLSQAGLPVAVQLVGAALREDLLVRAGRAVQAVTDWHLQRPAQACAGR
ncbi:MAG: amidase [Burkholderiales bacterium]|nr:MAG: amidase [Burkholderiales bacterium]